MKQLLVLICFVCLIAINSSTPQPRTDTVVGKGVRRYKVNIQDSPLVRWAPIIQDYKTDVQNFVKFFVSQSSTPGWVYSLIGTFGKFYWKRDFVRQIKAISKLSEVQFGKVFLLNFMYELRDYQSCTSIIVRNSKGEVFHGRNLDYSFAPYLSNLTATIDYYKNGVLTFTVDAQVGSVLVASGIRHGKYAVSEDQREEGSQWDNLKAFLFGRATPTLYLMFQVLRDEDTFNGALERLTNNKIIAPGYYILSGVGPDEGAIIERKRRNYNAIYFLNNTNWFIVQTNYDRSQPDPSDDYRRIPAEERLQAIGPDNINEQILMDEVMIQFPNFNRNTLLTCMMSAQQQYFNTTVWY